MFLVGCSGFDNFVCGEVSVQAKQNLELAEKLFSEDFGIEPIPCEYSYVNVYMMSSELDTCKLDSLQSIICRSTNKQVWSSIDLYDSNNNYLFTRAKNGTISRVERR